MDIRLDQYSSAPIYQQIAEQLRQLIAANQLSHGDRLPSIRQLSKSLNVNPNTVARAYLELEQEQIIIPRRGGGTIVASQANAPEARGLRQKRLLENVNEDIVRSLSQGYSPEEVEAAFYLNLERWREERQTKTEEPPEISTAGKKKNIIRIVGSHDLALSILFDLVRQQETDFQPEIIHAGSLGGLIALQEDRADLAGTHLLDEETGEYNYPYVKRVLPGWKIAIVNLAYRVQGLMFASGNPHQIKGLADLRRPDLVFLNRQKGSGTRVLLDMQLKQHGISPSEIRGYENECNTHLAVASSIAHGKADIGLGIEAAALSNSISFVPLFRERYDLVIPMANYRSPRLAPLIEKISNEEFKKVIDGIGGYDTSETGNVTFLD